MTRAKQTATGATLLRHLSNSYTMVVEHRNEFNIICDQKKQRTGIIKTSTGVYSPPNNATRTHTWTKPDGHSKFLCLLSQPQVSGILVLLRSLPANKQTEREIQQKGNTNDLPTALHEPSGGLAASSTGSLLDNQFLHHRLSSSGPSHSSSWPARELRCSIKLTSLGGNAIGEDRFLGY
jgi:hypothetical protein